MGFNLLITNRAGDVFFLFPSLPPPRTLSLLTVFWSHLFVLTNHTHLPKRNIKVWISYIPLSLSLFLSLYLSLSLHLSVSNTSCRARSWLIRALVANASSPSPSAEMNGDQMCSSYEVGSWVIGDTSYREGKDGKMRTSMRQMKRDERLLWDVSALRSSVISGRT